MQQGQMRQETPRFVIRDPDPIPRRLTHLCRPDSADRKRRNDDHEYTFKCQGSAVACTVFSHDGGAFRGGAAWNYVTLEQGFPLTSVSLLWSNCRNELGGDRAISAVSGVFACAACGRHADR